MRVIKNLMYGINKVLDWIENHMLLVLMAVLPVIICAQIVLRAVGGSLKWTEETARYMYIWVIYLGASRGVRFHSELSIDAIRNVMKDGSRIRAVYDAIRALLCVVFSAVLTRYSIAMVQNLIRWPQYSPAMHYNMIFLYFSSVMASILMLIRYLQQFVKEILNVIHPHKDEAEKVGEVE